MMQTADIFGVDGLPAFEELDINPAQRIGNILTGSRGPQRGQVDRLTGRDPFEINITEQLDDLTLQTFARM